MPRSIASAPGKVILFGEHAVVYGVTAIAAALSDLRIVVQVDTLPDPHLEIHLPDAFPDDKGSIISYDDLTRMLPHRTEPLSPIVPSESVINSLRELCVGKSDPLTQGIMAISFLTSNILPECVWGEGDTRRGVKIVVKSMGLPIGSGLGSSASFSVATSAALLRLRQLMYCDLFPDNLPVEEIAGDDSPEGWTPPVAILNMLNGWAYAAEVVIHGEPSGLDNTTSCFGGAVRLNRTLGRFETLPMLPDMTILLTNTNIPRSAKQLVGHVRKMHETYPTVLKPILESIEGISQEFLRLIDPAGTGSDHSLPHGSPDKRAGGSAMKAKTPVKPHKVHSLEEYIQSVGELMSFNHGLLNAMGVGHPALTKVFEASSRHGGMACKLTGAGGGGCAITLVPDGSEHLESLRNELCDLGFDTYVSKAGGHGVKWHVQYPEEKMDGTMRRGRLDMSKTDSPENSQTVRSTRASGSSVVLPSGASPTASAVWVYTAANTIVITVTTTCLTVLLGKVEPVILAILACLLGYLCSKIAVFFISALASGGKIGQTNRRD